MKLDASLKGKFVNVNGDKVKIVKLNIDENQMTASQFGIMSIPTMVLFKDGQPVEKLTGYHPKDVLVDYLETKLA